MRSRIEIQLLSFRSGRSSLFLLCVCCILALCSSRIWWTWQSIRMLALWVLLGLLRFALKWSGSWFEPATFWSSDDSARTASALGYYLMFKWIRTLWHSEFDFQNYFGKCGWEVRSNAREARSHGWVVTFEVIILLLWVFYFYIFMFTLISWSLYSLVLLIWCN